MRERQSAAALCRAWERGCRVQPNYTHKWATHPRLAGRGRTGRPFVIICTSSTCLVDCYYSFLFFFLRSVTLGFIMLHFIQGTFLRAQTGEEKPAQTVLFWRMEPETDRQTARQTGQTIGRRQIETWMGSNTEGDDTSLHAARQAEGQTGGQTDRQTDRRADGQHN